MSKQECAAGDVGGEPPGGLCVSPRGNTFLVALSRRRGVLLCVLDNISILGMFLLAYYLRFHLQFLAIKYVSPRSIMDYIGGAALLAGIWTFLVWRDKGYELGLRCMASLALRLRAVLVNGFYALALMMVISYMYRGLPSSRQVYLMTGVMAFAAMVLIRLFFRSIGQRLAHNGVVTQSIVVAGINERSRRFIIRTRSMGGGLQVIGILDCAAQEAADRNGFEDLPVLGSLAEIEEVYEKFCFDTLVLAGSEGNPEDRSGRGDRMIELVNFCEARSVSLYMLRDSFDIAIVQDEIADPGGVPMVLLQDASLHPVYAIVKRAIDIVVSAAVLVLGLPLWMFLAILIRITGRGPVFYTQIRVGLHGKPFRIYKFRTMVPDADQQLKDLVDIENLEEPGFKISNDPRVTPIGRLLRRTSLDEIPQLLNVFMGEMSLVGPRPEMEELVERYNPEQRRRLKAKPGITGYQQTRARGRPLSECIEYDLFYLKHQSMLLDLYILMRTVVVVIRGSGVTH